MKSLRIKLDRKGSQKYAKVSYPIRYGRFTEVEYGDFLFQFTRNGAIKYIVGKGPQWPHPAEWLKRTLGNNWVYYSTGSYYTGVVDLYGEFYLPCPEYPTNSLFKENPFDRKTVPEALQRWDELIHLITRSLKKDSVGKADPKDNFLVRAADNSRDHLQQKAGLLHRILKARIDVLPPDCRHVDYDIIPLIITDGCLYNCSFCDIKSGLELASRSRNEIIEQLYGLKNFLGRDLSNYNSIYLGQHDALCSDPDDIMFAVEQACEILEIGKSYMQGPKLFLFGSAESFLQQSERFWNSLNKLPFYSYINLGLESFDEKTLNFLKKPVMPETMKKGFTRMLEVNREYEHIEMTANFLLGDDLPDDHIPSLLEHINKEAGRSTAKGCIYLSPLKGSKNTKELLKQFRNIKQQSRMAAYLYLIQRL